MMALRLAAPEVLVDIAGVGLDRISVTDDGALRIGAMVRQRTAERDPSVATLAPLVAEALPHIGHLAVRNQGTVCGSIAHADPAAELPTVALASDAVMHVRGAAGRRSVPAADFFTGYYSTAVRSGELLESVEFPAQALRTGTAFAEVSRRHGDFALVGVAAVVRLDPEGSITRVSLVCSGVASTPRRVEGVEAALLGATPSDATLDDAAAAVRAEVDPSDDLHATAAYRRHVAGVLAARALRSAIGRAESA
jgi:carbon-monoxide dehydrogenase medium subunit